MLHYNTVTNLLRESLTQFMQTEIFKDFRLVGGTALSLQMGHRESVDIDLFSDLEYGKINFPAITNYLEEHFPYLDHLPIDPGMGKSYIIGTNAENTVKLDVFYTDPFIQPPLVIDRIRMATLEEIIAMKVDVVQRGGRKKDFWDLHALFESYSIKEMIEFHEKRYPYNHDRELILSNFTDFSQADDDFDPICFAGKYWSFIKDDIEILIKEFTKSNSDQ